MPEPAAALLSARLAEVASSAERSGASTPAVRRLLEAASEATLRALALTLLLDGTHPRAAVPEPELTELRDAA